jgi:serine/threonine protein kinase
MHAMTDVCRILVVDDNQMNRDMLSRRLARRGYEVDVAEGGRAALEKLESGDFDLVLLDLQMPDLSGFEVLEVIRSTHSTFELPVLMVTANAESERVVDALKMGANDYVTKPIDFPVILARIEAQLAVSRSHIANRIESRARRPQENPRVIDGRYELLSRIGEGGFAVVYKARQVSTGQLVAVKVLRASTNASKSGAVQRARFEREMQVIGSIRHPNIVRLIDSGRVDPAEIDPMLVREAINNTAPTAFVGGGDATGAATTPVGRRTPQPKVEAADLNDPDRLLPYIVMDFLEGETLDEYLERHIRMPVRSAIQMMIPVMRAIETAHNHNVIHRDLKPSNIFMARMTDGSIQPQVLDFGIAKVASPDLARLTPTISVIGTPQYMSPEQARGMPVDAASDQFSLAIVLFECVTGCSPYESTAFVPLIQEVARGKVEPHRSVNPGISRELNEVIVRATQLEPSERFASVAAFADALEQAKRPGVH